MTTVDPTAGITCYPSLGGLAIICLLNRFSEIELVKRVGGKGLDPSKQKTHTHSRG